jgi:P-type Cu2+ transporter
VVLDTRGLHFASEAVLVERALGGHEGVSRVEANPVAQTATVAFDPEVTDVDALVARVRECRLHCAGESVPGHVCLPRSGARPAEGDRAVREAGSPGDEHEAMAHDAPAHGGHAGMSMDAMVRDMRNRFVVALAFAIPITMYSHIGMDLLGLLLPIPFGLRSDVWQLLLSVPVIFYSSSISSRGRGRRCGSGRWT